MNTPIKRIVVFLSIAVVIALVPTQLHCNCGSSGKYQFSGIDGETTSDVFTIEENGYYQFSNLVAGGGTITVDIYRNDIHVEQKSHRIAGSNPAASMNTPSYSLGGPGNYYIVVNSSDVRWTMTIWDLSEPIEWLE